MKVVKTIFWLLLATVLVLFALANWLPVEVSIGGGLVLETRLPLLVIAAFLAGLVPTWIIHRVARARWKRRSSGEGEDTVSGPLAAGADDDLAEPRARPFAR